MSRIIFACLLLAFSSPSDGAEDFIYKLHNNVSIGYCAEHDYFCYYNPHMDLAFVYNSKLDLTLYAGTKHHGLMLIANDYGYYFKSNYTYDFDTKEGFIASFDYMWCQMEPLVHAVHGGGCETCNGVSKDEFKNDLLHDDELELSTWPMFVKRPKLAVLIKKAFYKLLVETQHDLRNFTTLVHYKSSFTYAGIQSTDEQCTSVAIIYSALVSNRIDHTEELSTEFYKKLENNSYGELENLGHALKLSNIIYQNCSEVLKRYSLSFTFKTKKITVQKLEQKVTFTRDIETLDWQVKFETQSDVLRIIYYADINVFVFWRRHYVFLYNGEGNNYAVYNLYNGVGIIVSKTSGKATITFVDATEISGHYINFKFREAVECATKVMKSTVPDQCKGAFNFGLFIQSCWEHKAVYRPWFSKETVHKLYMYFEGIIKSLFLRKNYDLIHKCSNMILIAFRPFKLDNLETQFQKLVHKIGIKSGSSFDSNLMTHVYNNLERSSNGSFKGPIFKDCGV